MFRKCSYIWVAMGPFYQMTPTNLTIMYAWMNRSHVCEREQNPVLTGIGICVGCYQQNWESWKRLEFVIFRWFSDNLWKNRHCCVYNILTYAIDNFMLHQTIHYFIDYFLVCSVINDVIQSLEVRTRIHTDDLKLLPRRFYGTRLTSS